MANGAFKFKDNSGNVVSHISGSGRDILFSGGTLDLSGMTGLTLGNLTLSGTTQNAQTASFAPSYLLTSSFNTYSSSLATTGSNLFKGNQTISGSIIPAVDNTYDLGSLTNQFRDLYLSSASLYIDGTKVLGSTAQELQITTDAGQSFKILESSSDTITLQSADGNITLAASGGGDVIMDPTTGVIALKGTTTLYAGNKIVSSDGNSIQFGNGIAITGSIVSTVTPLVSGSSQIIYSGLTGIPSGIVSGSSQLTSSYDSRYVLSGSITQTTWDNIASKPSGIASGSSQIDITGTTGYSTFSSSISTSIGSLSSSVATTTSGLSSSIGSLSSSVATTTLGTKNRVDSIEAKTGSYATTGSNIYQGNQTITGSLYISQDLIVAGSSSIQNISSSIVNISDNIITVNALNPSIRFGGLAVIDSGSSPQVSGSILFDSVNNQWIFVHQNQSTITSSILLMGPQTFNNLGNETALTNNRLLKSVNDEHLGDSNVTDTGTLVSINSNTEVTGTLKVTSTITGTLSGNASTATSSSYATTAGSAGSSTSSTTAATASYILGSNVSGNISGNAATATSSSYATTSTSSSYSTTAGSAGSATSATTAATASYVLGSNVSGNISGNAGTATSATTAATASYVAGANVSGNITGNAATATSSSYATTAGTAGSATSATTAATASYVLGSNVSGNISGNATTATTAATASYVAGTNVSGNISGNAGTVTGGVYTSGDQTIAGAKTFSGTILFGSAVRQMLNLYSTSYGIGVQSSTQYFRTDGRFSWYNGGVHSDTENTPGAGGTNLMTLSSVGNLTVTGTIGASNFSGTHSGASSGTNTGDQTSVSGNAGTVTNGVYTTGDQSISGTKTFAVIKGDSGADYPHSFTNTDAGNTHWTNRNGRMLTSNGTNWASDGRDPIMAIVGSTADTTRGRMIGITFHNDNNTVNAFSPTISFSAKSNSSSYNSEYASIYGRNSGAASGLDTNWNKGELHFTVHGDIAVSDTPTLKLTQTISTFDTNLVVNNGTKTYFNSTDGYAIKVDSSSSSTENDIRFAKGGTDYGAIQTNGSDHGFEFYVNTDGSSNGWQRMFYMKRDATESIFDRGTVRPGANGTQNLGTASYRWSTIYTSDLSLSNGIGDYTIVEGEEKLYLYNNKNNKVYSFVLQEEDPSTATPKKS